MSRKKQTTNAPDKVEQMSVDTTRRSTLKWALWGIGAVATAEFLYVGAKYLSPRKAAGQGLSPIVEAGRADEFPSGSVTAFPEGKFYLVRLAEGGFLALSRECTHLGCTVPWDAEAAQFRCPCHASSFDITGEVLTPPAPRALDLFEVVVFDGFVTVDTSKRTRRDHFDPAQLVKG